MFKNSCIGIRLEVCWEIVECCGARDCEPLIAKFESCCRNEVISTACGVQLHPRRDAGNGLQHVRQIRWCSTVDPLVHQKTRFIANAVFDG
jgi:hypothetical protein